LSEDSFPSKNSGWSFTSSMVGATTHPLLF
jgi:hypothetical protein